MIVTLARVCVLSTKNLESGKSRSKDTIIGMLPVFKVHVIKTIFNLQNLIQRPKRPHKVGKYDYCSYEQYGFFKVKNGV